jgi:hypothetical protein
MSAASTVAIAQGLSNFDYVSGALLGVACYNFITAFDVKCNAWTRVPLFLGAVSQIALSVSLLFTSYNLVASWYFPEYFTAWKQDVIFSICVVFIEYICRIFLYIQRIRIVLIPHNSWFAILQAGWLSFGLLQFAAITMLLYGTSTATDYAVSATTSYTALIVNNVPLQTVSLVAIIYAIILTILTDGCIVYVFYVTSKGIGQSFFQNYSKSRVAKLVVYLGFTLTYVVAMATNSFLPESVTPILNYFSFIEYAILLDFYLVDVAKFTSRGTNRTIVDSSSGQTNSQKNTMVPHQNVV